MSVLRLTTKQTSNYSVIVLHVWKNIAWFERNWAVSIHTGQAPHTHENKCRSTYIQTVREESNRDFTAQRRYYLSSKDSCNWRSIRPRCILTVREVMQNALCRRFTQQLNLKYLCLEKKRMTSQGIRAWFKQKTYKEKLKVFEKFIRRQLPNRI